MEFNNKLYELRKQKGFSQEELASRLNVSRQTVSKWELGESSPDMEKLVAMSDLFGITLDELVLDKAPVQPESAPTSAKTDIAGEIKEKVLTEDNKWKAKKGLKIAGIILGVIVIIDLLSMIIYFVLFGAPA